ncbi:MAG: MerR family transcriptional regulator [Sediminibacterium sp. Gen4]|jgi:MerR family transcriptional regulator, light-induced transcriptional regulator|uniref:MerR family transcriptional regulator n=1 Tax=unclassified Sediminibacterium TaxID=2635961 RepID=UPI0015B92B9E|nr:MULTISPECIES: MerR family transcriptional regulator [unclassified Sediminibacterium]MBW0162767.1 MerR family transcriptional regulator [Sediminibacterium sp.]NWK67477.1 MerR family transcriptional regulator [Sediminibacterium sp. Gen4]
MNHFTIKDIENLSGIKAHTLRIWEQRYQLFIPKRKESKHRYYDNEDLKHILRISQLYHNGVKISKIAQLPASSIRSMAMEQYIGKQNADAYIHRLIEASIDFDEERFEELFEQALKQFGLEVTIIDVMYAFLERIGLLWLTDHVIPAQEHFASNIIKRKIISALDALKTKPSPSSGTYVLFTPEGEQHEIPLLLNHYLMKASGKKCIYMGVDVPFDDIDIYVKLKNPKYLYFHAITHLYEQPMDDLLKQLKQKFSQQEIIMSGPLTKEVTLDIPGVTLLRSMPEMLEFAKRC